MGLEKNMFWEKSSGIVPSRRCGLTLEDRVPLLPPMHLMARGTLDRVLLIDRQHLECLRIHRKARINELARSWALDHYAVHLVLGGRAD